MVTSGGGRVEVGETGVEEQAERVIHKKETINLIRGMGELYQQGMAAPCTYKLGAFHFFITSTNGGRIFFALNGYQPISPRTACSFNSVEPQMRDAPNAPSKAEAQLFEMNNEPKMHNTPVPITYGHHK